MGWTPQQVNAMSVTEYSGTLRAYGELHEDKSKMSEAEANEIWEWMQDKPQVVN